MVQSIVTAIPLGSIRIESTPSGGAPEEIRKLWVGVEMPCLYFVENDDRSFNIATKERVATKRSYIVLQVDALNALAEKNRAASEWWEAAGFPLAMDSMFSFDADCAREIKAVYGSREEYLQQFPELEEE